MTGAYARAPIQEIAITGGSASVIVIVRCVRANPPLDERWTYLVRRKRTRTGSAVSVQTRLLGELISGDDIKIPPAVIFARRELGLGHMTREKSSSGLQ